MIDTLSDYIDDIKVFLYGGVQSLPLSLGGTMLILGLFTANYGMLFFLIGYLILTPLAVWGVNAIFNNMPGDKWYPLTLTSACKIYTTDRTKEESVFLSTYLSMVAFFVGYIINNALDLFNKEDNKDESTEIEVKTTVNKSIVSKSIDSKIMNRKSRTIMSVIMAGLILLLVIYIRSNSSCEGTDYRRFIRILLSVSLFGAGGYFWYSTLTTDMMSNRLSDLFGIANRLLPPVSISNAPVACLPYSG